uniref:Uncharacterized protein n=1 Tax=Arion vulgaris TaxID=1028688 RepID=A0A0B6YZD1_9EUPU
MYIEFKIDISTMCTCGQKLLREHLLQDYPEYDILRLTVVLSVVVSLTVISY